MKINWTFVVGGILALTLVVILLMGWGKLAGILGAFSAGVWGLFNTDKGKKAVEGVKKRAKLKAKDVPDTNPDSVVSDINKRISD